MANEFIRALQVVSVNFGPLQSNGLQPAAVVLGDTSTFTVVINTDASDPVSQYAVGTPLWVRVDDTNPGVAIPPPAAAVSESTAPVITATVEQFDPPTAQ